MIGIQPKNVFKTLFVAENTHPLALPYKGQTLASCASADCYVSSYVTMEVLSIGKDMSE